MYSQWTIMHQSPANGIGAGVSLDTEVKVSGVSALNLRGGNGAFVTAGLTTGAGITTGQIRSMVRWDSGAGGGLDQIGVFAMSPSFDLTTDFAYWLIVNSGGCTLRKAHANGSATGATTLGTGSGSPTSGVWMAVQLAWVFDAGANEMLLTCKSGANFGSMTDKIIVTDTSPLTTAVTAGVGGAHSQIDARLWWDLTEISQP